MSITGDMTSEIALTSGEAAYYGSLEATAHADLIEDSAVVSEFPDQTLNTPFDSVTSETAGPGFETKTALEALSIELNVLSIAERGATNGELARIEALAARVGKELYPNIETPGSYAAVWSQIASRYEFAETSSETSLIALELACLELAYPDLNGVGQ